MLIYTSFPCNGKSSRCQGDTQLAKLLLIRLEDLMLFLNRHTDSHTHIHKSPIVVIM